MIFFFLGRMTNKRLACGINSRVFVIILRVVHFNEPVYTGQKELGREIHFSITKSPAALKALNVLLDSTRAAGKAEDPVHVVKTSAS